MLLGVGCVGRDSFYSRTCLSSKMEKVEEAPGHSVIDNALLHWSLFDMFDRLNKVKGNVSTPDSVQMPR